MATESKTKEPYNEDRFMKSLLASVQSTLEDYTDAIPGLTSKKPKKISVGGYVQEFVADEYVVQVSIVKKVSSDKKD